MTMPWDANSRFSPVATEDLAHVIVAILENPVTHSGKTYPLLRAFWPLGVLRQYALGSGHVRTRQCPRKSS